MIARLSTEDACTRYRAALVRSRWIGDEEVWRDALESLGLPRFDNPPSDEAFRSLYESRS